MNPAKYIGYAASIPGAGHIRFDIPCQDASLAILEPRAALIVCDGRGSAKLSHLGAAGAIKAFRNQLAIMEPFIASILDFEQNDDEQWCKFCRIMYRTLMQVKIDLAEVHSASEKEFDFTVAFAVTGKKHIGCFQVGDGAIVVQQDFECITVFQPEKGEFANQTHFLRQNGEVKTAFQYKLFPVQNNSGIAITSDGPEHVMFKLPEMAPGKIFNAMFDDLAAGHLCRQDIMDFLTSPDWNNDPRGTDDRSLAILMPDQTLISKDPEIQMDDTFSDKKNMDNCVCNNAINSDIAICNEKINNHKPNIFTTIVIILLCIISVTFGYIKYYNSITITHLQKIIDIQEKYDRQPKEYKL